MRALVTGGAGFIGSSLARTLLGRGWDVRVLDNLLNGFEENVPREADFILGDLREPETVRAACEDIDVVFHQGALRSVPRSVDDPVLSASCNVIGTLNVLVAAEQAKVRRVVYASSSSVYGDVPKGLQREDMTPSPLSPYAVSKLTAEQYCGVWTRLKGLSTVSLRYFNVYGPGQHPESKYSAVFPAFISALVQNRPPEIHWDGLQERDFSYIDDVVEANVLAATATADGIDGSILNIAGGEPKTVNDVLRAVSDASGTWIDPVRTPKRAGDVRRTHADTGRARELLRWSPRADWVESVRQTVAWFLDGRYRDTVATASRTVDTASSSVRTVIR